MRRSWEGSVTEGFDGLRLAAGWPVDEQTDVRACVALCGRVGGYLAVAADEPSREHTPVPQRLPGSASFRPFHIGSGTGFTLCRIGTGMWLMPAALFQD